jgi:AcrR family transcriptional regulator
MGYSPEHKLETRNKILEVAAAAFREHGYVAVSIDRLMQAAGLTRGGFYAHFENKKALFSEVLSQDFGLFKKLRQARLGEFVSVINGQEIVHSPHDVLNYYLAVENIEEISRDCHLAMLTADARRVGGEAQEAYSATVKLLVDEFEHICSNSDHAHQLAVQCLGAVNIASTVSDKDLQAKLLAAALKLVNQHLADA